VLGGWTFSPLLTAQSGSPLNPLYSEGGCTGCQAFGEVSTTSSNTTSFTTNTMGVSPYTGAGKASYNNFGSSVAVNGTTTSVGTNNSGGVNYFSDPGQVWSEFRKCVLGFDQNCGGFALRGLSRWNVDLGIHKNINFWKEGIGAELSFQFTNVLNHAAMGSPTLTLTSPATWGRITGTASSARNAEFGLRIHF